jgi:hypothetical protein
MTIMSGKKAAKINTKGDGKIGLSLLLRTPCQPAMLSIELLRAPGGIGMMDRGPSMIEGGPKIMRE